MYLALLAAVVTAAAPWLRGTWDLWAQTGVALFLLLATSLWLAVRIIRGAVPVPNARHTAFLAALAGVLAVSAVLSPVRGASLPGLLPWAVTLWILYAVPLIPEERRVLIENAWIAGGWGLVLLAFYQRLVERTPHPEASLLNPNVFATFVLILLPLAWERGRTFLFLGLAAALWWADSLSAWIAVSALLVAVNFRRGGLGLGLSLLAAFVCLVGLHEKLAEPSFLDRLFWWRAAGAMARSRPLTGFGPGTFADVFPAFRPWLGNLSSQYAHQYPLETAAELGFPFAIAWLAWILKRWTETGGWARQALLMCMVQSLAEYGLSIPSNAWMLAYLLVADYPLEPVWISLPGRLKLPGLLVLAGLTGLAVGAVAAPWRAQVGWVRAGEAAAAGRLDQAEALLDEAGRRFPPDPVPDLARASIAERLYGADRRPSLLWRAAALTETAVVKNPFDARAWSVLEAVYAKLGRPDLAERTRLRAREKSS